jgi:hypothetical protein
LQVALAKLLLQTRPRSEDLLPIVARRLQWDELVRTEKADPAVVDVVRVVLARSAVAAQRRGPRRNATSRYVALSVAGLVGLILVFATLVVVIAPRAPPRSTGRAMPIGSVASEILPDRDGALHPIALSDGGQTGDEGFDGRPSKTPTVSISSGAVRVRIASPTPGAADLLCGEEAPDGGLQGCRVVCATKPELGDAALSFAETLQFAMGAPLPSHSPLRVHLVWRDATAPQRPVDILCSQGASAPDGGGGVS